jgi:hypothetical protein
MTSFEIQQLDPEQIHPEDAIAQALYLDGKADAATGNSPQSKEPMYLNGYLLALREGIEQGTYTLQIRWLSASFLRGAYDGDER